MSTSTLIQALPNQNGHHNSQNDCTFDQTEYSPPIIDKTEDVCEKVLGNKMAALELKELKTISGSGGGDGSDSGVDIANCLSIGLQRALSSNSGGYASSNGGLDEPNLNGNLSCDSSMISYSSDIGENHKALQVSNNTVLVKNANYECTSENGSESSSIAGEQSSIIRKTNVVKKKVALQEPTTASSSYLPKSMSLHMKKPNTNGFDQSPTTTSSTAGQLINRPRSRPIGICRTQSLTRPSPPVLQTRERARSRDKGTSSSSSKTTTPPFRSTPIRSRPPKPDSLPCALVTVSPNVQRIVQRTPSLTRARTPGTPSDDGRWPSVGARTAVSMAAPKRSGSTAPETVSVKSRINMLTFDAQKFTSPSISAYATLPRRKKQKSVEDLTTGGRSSRSSSASRDKMTSSAIVTGKKSTPNQRESITGSKVTSPFSRSRKPAVPPRVKIYHETSIQTAITGQDVESALAGVGIGRVIRVDAVEMGTKGTQSDIRDKEMNAMQEKIRQLIESKDELQNRLDEKTKKIIQLESQVNKEREEKLQVQKELHVNTERVVGILELARGTPTEEQGYDSLLMLESQIQMSGHELTEKQEEINKLRRICRTLQNEMQRSLTAQECLMKEKVNLERESYELQEFLQNEKAALCDALKEAENEVKSFQNRLNDKDEEVKVLRDECRHLVRLNEQRRQEIKTMQSKYSALEQRSKDIVVQRSSAVSGASMALNGLNSRLDSLVEQLISSYNISEQDLEDVVFHNEAYTNSGSSGEGSPEYDNNINCNGNGNLNNEQNNDGSLSPQRNQSFIAAVISAIKNATSSTIKINRQKKSTNNENLEESDSTEMLDSETEPCCLMMDNVLEDVTMPDSHSHNMVSSSGIMISQIDIPSDIMHGDESLQNLSQAITNRQQIELQISTMAAHKINQLKHETSITEDLSCHDSVAEMPSLSDYCSTQALVDQVIEVDNLVTKLLKVLRLIQMDNDNCIQQLITDKNKLQLKQEEMLEKIKDIEDINIKLSDELMDATQELMIQNADLSNNKAELQGHRNEIDRLNQDICNLSQLCSQSQLLQEESNKNVQSNDVLQTLKIWHENGQFLEPDNLNFIATVCNEIPILKMKLLGLENVCMYQHVWQQNELPQQIVNDDASKRQYEIIDHVLDVLYSVQEKVNEHPCLIQLQKELEETNFNATLNQFPLFMNGNNDGCTKSDYKNMLTANQMNYEEQKIIDDINANESPKNVDNTTSTSMVSF